MTQYQRGILVMDYLQSLGMDMIKVSRAVGNGNLDKSYQLIMDNPKITKEEFIKEMNLEEED